ncbi:hypothetical protein V8B97DRAFT_2024705 [Scleroderma yunnanense]
MASAVSHLKPYTWPHNIACKDIWVITSPNIGFVPEPHIFKDKDLQPHADGHFRLDSVPSLAIAWYDLTQDDFIVPTGSKSVVGTLQDARVKEFEQLLWLLHNHHHHLWDRMAAKDLVIFVVQFQCTLLDIHALLDYIEILHPLLASPPSKPVPMNPTWMGCFTKDTEVFRAMYSENGVVKLHYEGTLAEQPEPIAGPSAAHPISTQQHSLDGGKHVTQKQTRTARVKAATGPYMKVSPHQGSVGAKAKGEETNPLDIPDPHSLFKSAWKKVDQNLQQHKSGFVDPGYHFLKPSLFSASSKLVVLDILEENIVQVAAKGLAEAWEEIVWQGMQLYELNFCYELYTLDCAIVPECWTTSEAQTWQALLHSIFPGRYGLRMWSEPLPWELHELGMCTHSMEVALSYMDGQDNSECYKLFLTVCQFYLQTAFDFLGQQPSLLHVFSFI